MKIRISFGENTLNGFLNDSVTAEALTRMLPLTLEMQNLYGREMVYRFPQALPTDNVRHTGYEVGDIVYWPPRHSFVFMYAQNGEMFSMQKVGTISSGLDVFRSIDVTEVTIEAVAE